MNNEAIACFKEAVSICPSCWPAWGGLGHAFVKIEDWGRAENVGRTADASVELQEAIENDPEFAPAYFEFGYLQYVLGDFELSEGYLRSCLELEEWDYEAPYWHGIVLRKMGRTAEARREFQECRTHKRALRISE
jgi:tetratricopeptide (TPR) repeat protein